MAQESWRLGMDETGCQPPEGPVLCAKNCGFFGSKSTMNMCSKCYRDHVLEHAREIPERPESQRALKLGEPSVPFLPKETSEATSICTSGSSSEDANVSASVAGSQEQQKSLPNRCFSCRKRVGLTGFKCRCGNVFCSMHRYSDKHDCSVDYKTLGRDAIAKANPVVAANKIDKI